MCEAGYERLLGDCGEREPTGEAWAQDFEGTAPGAKPPPPRCWEMWDALRQTLTPVARFRHVFVAFARTIDA